MKQRVYIAGGDPAVLSYNSKELSFGGETLTFWVKGLTHFDVNAFVFADTEMGEATINLDLILPPDIQPEFDRFWYVDFRGERFYLSTLKPTCVKNTDSLQYTYSLIFKSQRSDLERYEFANFVQASSTPQVVSYDFSLPLPISDPISGNGFVERMNINLEYYFGSGVWQMVLDPSYMSNINTAIYDGTSRVTLAFSRQSLWSVITGIYETFGVRWRIASESGIMTIRLGYTPITLDHTFEYGKDNGLVSIERINPQTPVYTRLSGRGANRNLPYRYFDTATSQYQGDTDNNTYTQNIPYSNIMPASYRQYVKGWNDKTAENPIDSSTYAYLKGYNDASTGANFNPVDYVVSKEAEDIYGIKKCSVADADDIFPTFNGQILGVEEVLSDDYDGTDADLNQTVADSISYCNYQGDREFNNSWTMQSEPFETLENFDNISFYLTLDVSTNGVNTFTFNHTCLVEILDGNSVVDSSSFTITNSSTYLTSTLVKFENLDPSVYTIRISSTFSQTSGRQVYCTQTATKIIRHPKNAYKDIFDIWIGNIWDSSQNSGESDEEYMLRVWQPLISPSGDITVMFRDGMLAGEDYEFKIAKPEGEGNDYYIFHDESVVGSHWRLSLLKSDANIESSKLPLPNTFQNASVGDSYFFVNIEMPYHPYVYDAEQRLEEFLQKELLKVNNENPTYSITPSSVFLESYDQNASIATGAQLKISDAKMVGEGYITLSITNLTIEYTSDSILPKWDVTVAEKPTSAKNSIQVLQGDVKVLSSNLLSAQQLTEQIQLALDERYLQKSGIEQTSYSKTTFKDTLSIAANIQSEEYLQGQVGGYGFSIFKDTTGSYVMEIDKLNVRKVLNINELVVNQVSIYGGIHVYSAAAMTVSSVDSSNAAYHVCYMDIKNGTVLNQFVAGDHAYCQRFEPETGQLLKYYWKEVVAVGSDYIAISKTGGDGSVNQIPTVGDNIAQLGNASDPARQSALIIDQTNGGTVTQYAAIDNFSLTNKDYIRYGVDPATGRAYERIYGDFYAGGRNQSTDNYIGFDQSTGDIAFRGTIRQDSVVKDAYGNQSYLTVDRGVWDASTVYYAGNTVFYAGSTYTCDSQTTEGILPTNESYWHISATKGADGTSVKILGSVDTSVNLPDPYSGNIGDGYITEDTGHLWVYNGVDWTDVGQIKGDKGDTGTAGGNTAIVYLYKRSATTPSYDGGSGFTYTFSSKQITSGTLGTWSQTIPSGTDPLWVMAATAYANTPTAPIIPSDWSSPVILAENGATGATGLSSASVLLYQRAASTPSVPTSATTYTFSSGVLSGTLGSWTQAIPASDGNPCYVIIATAVAATATDSILPAEWSAPRILVHDGEDAKLIRLSASSQLISETESGSRTPSSIAITATTQNTTISGWTYAVNGGAFSGAAPSGVTPSGNTVNISSALVNFTTLSVKATDGTVSDIVTVSRVINGDSALNVVLSNEAHTVSCDAAGNVLSGELTSAKTRVNVYRGGDLLLLGTDWTISDTEASDGITYNVSLNEISITAIGQEVQGGYVDISIAVGASVIQKRFTIAKSKQGIIGQTGNPAVSIYCDSQNISVTPNTNTFTKEITIKLLEGGVPVATSAYTRSKSLVGLSAGSDVVGTNDWKITLAAFTSETVSVGYVNVSIGYDDNIYQISISVARVVNPAMIVKGNWIAGLAYTGNCLQRDVVKYTNGNWYAAKINIGSTSTTWVAGEWELFNSFTNVATDTLLAANANIAGFIYKDERMVSQSGTIAGNASTNWAHPDFIPNLTIDGSTGQIVANQATIKGSLEAASGNFKALSNGTFEIDFESVVEGGTRRMEIKSSTGEIVSSLVGQEDSYSSFSTDGIFVNRAAINPLPSIAGINAASGISSLGNASVSGLYDPDAFVCGVYGVATNSATDPAPAYGGYFEKLFAKGLLVSIRNVGNSSVILTPQDTYVCCINTTATVTVNLPANPLIGQTYFIKRVANNPVYVSGNGKNLFSNSTITSYLIDTVGLGVTVTWQGSYWLLFVL